ncbi:MAG: hypothetical protein JJ953_11950 [Gracilimonas sp.]|uniref:hypothetical protein n=1 Tax=Gracilimonas TaxID=649462 RepID=UPI001B07AD38|nr:hypothetical protein [Gracilimonas sp.]MBO6586811.1 hypothetical protein [Gracilimonas sp.]MBO6614701.1 hypothetical protein [Gracilimonas sp.]
MEINKLTNHVNGQIKSTDASENSQQASKVSRAEKSPELTDKVSLENFSAKKSEELFAKIELEKQNQASFGKLKDYKAKLQAYEAAKKESPEAAKNTEIGKMLNDPEVWSKIAQNIVDK